MKSLNFFEIKLKKSIIMIICIPIMLCTSFCASALQEDHKTLLVGESFTPVLDRNDAVTKYDPSYLEFRAGTFTALKSGKTEIIITNTKEEIVEKDQDTTDDNGIFHLPEYEILKTQTQRKISVDIYDPITKLDLNKTCVTLGKGEKFSLSYTFNDNVKQEVPSFVSDAPSVASISKSGEITAEKVGTATITATTSNAVKNRCTVIVKEAPQYVNLSKTEYKINVNETFKLDASVNDEAACFAYKFSSSDESVATVSKDGLVSVKAKVGTAVIKVTTYNGKSAVCNVEVFDLPEEIILSKNCITLGKGERYTIKPKTDSGTYTPKYTYKTSDDKIVSVSKNGKVKALKKGNAKITIETHNGVKKTLKITIKSAPKKLSFKKSNYTVSIGKKITPKYVFSSSQYSNTVKLKSSNKKVAKITSDGRIWARSMGKAVITATTFNGKKAYITVNVKAIKVPFCSQFPNYPTGCEAASCVELLRYYKYDITLNQMIKYIPRENIVYKNGKRYGPQITEKFVGDPRHGYGGSSPGYGAFSPCVTKALQKAINASSGKHKAVCLTGCSFNDLLNTISKGKPAIVWATYEMLTPRSVNSWYARQEDGTYKYFEYPRGTHVFVLIGYSESSVTIMDPCGGTKSYNISTFRNRWNLLGKQAIVLEKKK